MMRAATQEEEQPVVRLSIWPEHYTHATFASALDRIHGDPSVTEVWLTSAPRDAEAVELHRCLKRAPHVRLVGFEAHNNEYPGVGDWLIGMDSTLRIGFDDLPPKLSPDSSTLLATANMRQVEFSGLAEWAVALFETRACSATRLAWRLNAQLVDSLEGALLATRLLTAVGRLTCFTFTHGSLSEAMVAVLADALSSSSTLTSLKLENEGCEGSASLAPLWIGLRDSRTCVLRRVVFSGVDEDFDHLDEFFATTQAKGHLVELELSECGRRSAWRLLPAIAANLHDLLVLKLHFGSMARDYPPRLLNHGNSNGVADDDKPSARYDWLSVSVGAWHRQLGGPSTRG